MAEVDVPVPDAGAAGAAGWVLRKRPRARPDSALRDQARPTAPGAPERSSAGRRRGELRARSWSSHGMLVRSLSAGARRTARNPDKGIHRSPRAPPPGRPGVGASRPRLAAPRICDETDPRFWTTGTQPTLSTPERRSAKIHPAPASRQHPLRGDLPGAAGQGAPCTGHLAQPEGSVGPIAEDETL
jgi:hypothetical protein